MRDRVRAFNDVLRGEVIAVRAKPATREKYQQAGVLETRGSFILVPKEHAKQKARIKKGELVEVIKPLKWGQEAEVILPWKVESVESLTKHLEEYSDQVDKLKYNDELFAFRLFGHESLQSFPDAEHQANYLMRHYHHLFTPKQGEVAIKHFSMIRYKGNALQVPRNPFAKKIYSVPGTGRDKGVKKNSRIRAYEKLERDRRNEKRYNRRANETAEQRANRLTKQRERSRQNRKNKKDK